MGSMGRMESIEGIESMGSHMGESVYLNDLGIVTSLGQGKEASLAALNSGSREHFSYQSAGERSYPIALCSDLFKDSRDPCISRINVLLENVCSQIEASVEILKSQFPPERIGVILGSTDNGSEQSLMALQEFRSRGSYPADYSLEHQQAHYPVDFVKKRLGIGGYSTSISTACTSSGSAMILARKLILSGIIDGAVVGGADIVSDSVLKGFVSLEAVDHGLTNPFSRNRNGINLGEGAALFVMSGKPLPGARIQLTGCGESSDAHHMTAPDPEGRGAMRAMRAALEDAGNPGIDYINLHGTGTVLNDSMEAVATKGVFSVLPPSSSTKALTGHTLGAASAVELGFCWLVLNSPRDHQQLPGHCWDGVPSEGVPLLNFVSPRQESVSPNPKINTCMSNSYAFGGCNVSLIITNGETEK